MTQTLLTLADSAKVLNVSYQRPRNLPVTVSCLGSFGRQVRIHPDKLREFIETVADASWWLRCERPKWKGPRAQAQRR